MWPKKTLKIQKKKKKKQTNKQMRVKNAIVLKKFPKRPKKPNFKKAVIAGGYLFY
jgi:hypothetical protein